MNIDVNGVSITLTEDQLKHIDSELKKKNNQISAEKTFLNLWNGCIIKFDFSKSDSIFMLKNDEVLFEQDFKNGYLWCNYYKVWSVFYLKYSMNYEQRQAFIKDILEKRFKLGYLTPQAAASAMVPELEKRFKLGYLTPDLSSYYPRAHWKSVSNWQ